MVRRDVISSASAVLAISLTILTYSNVISGSAQYFAYAAIVFLVMVFAFTFDFGEKEIPYP